MAESFNIDRFVDGSGKVDLSDIDWAEVPKHRLTPEALRALKYFLVTESSTFFYMRSLIQTDAAAREPDFAPFLCVWMYEEEFHGRAFGRFLEAYGEPVSKEWRGERFAGRTLGERFDEIAQNAFSMAFREDWPAVHMVWGSIQELTTYHAYQSLIERIGHPVLTTICQRIMKQELRHYAFYREQAKKRLAASSVARRLATFALKTAWTPVGDGMSSKEDVQHAIRFLFDGLDGEAIARVEKKTRELPGLEWFDLFTKYATEHQIRRAPASWFPKRQAAEAEAPQIVAI